VHGKGSVGAPAAIVNVLLMWRFGRSGFPSPLSATHIVPPLSVAAPLSITSGLRPNRLSLVMDRCPSPALVKVPPTVSVPPPAIVPVFPEWVAVIAPETARVTSFEKVILPVPDRASVPAVAAAATLTLSAVAISTLSPESGTSLQDQFEAVCQLPPEPPV
jgi:hypothetical protein